MGRLAKTLLSKQVFPDTKLKTYDDAAWTMGMMSHVEVVQSDDKTALDIPVESLDHYEPQGWIDGPSAPAYAVLDFGSNNFATLRNRLHGVSIQIAEQSFTSNSRTIPAGSFHRQWQCLPETKAAVIPLGLRLSPCMTSPARIRMRRRHLVLRSTAPGAAPRMSAGYAMPLTSLKRPIN